MNSCGKVIKICFNASTADHLRVHPPAKQTKIKLFVFKFALFLDSCIFVQRIELWMLTKFNQRLGIKF